MNGQVQDSLLTHASTLLNTILSSFGTHFEEICAGVMGAKQKEQLRRMIDFRFKRHPLLNFPEHHLQALEKLLEARVRKLLTIPSHGKATKN